MSGSGDQPLRQTSFNPRPAFWPGATHLHATQPDEVDVSILARPFGRALCGTSTSGTVRLPTGFNPRPAFWPGATRMRHEQGLTLKVSILARPFGRALRRKCMCGCQQLRCFNPRPAFWPGATSRNAWVVGLLGCFNPRPAFWPGRTTAFSTYAVKCIMFQSSPGLLAGRYAAPDSVRLSTLGVSILARPFGRARTPGRAGVYCRDHARFNPRPAFWPGATLILGCCLHHHFSFQSSPGLLAGRYVTIPMSAR